MSEELAEIARLREQLARAEQNAEDWKSIAQTIEIGSEAWRESALRHMAWIERGQKAEQELVTLKQELAKVERERLDYLTQAFVLKFVARRLVAAWRAERKGGKA